jgi:hypothetical protein
MQDLTALAEREGSAAGVVDHQHARLFSPSRGGAW